MRPRTVEAYAPGVIEPIARRHLDACGRPGRRADERLLRAGLGARAGRRDGARRPRRRDARRWFGDLATGGANFEQDPEKQAVADATSTEIDDASPRFSTGSSASPTASVLSHMLAADATRAEVLSNLKLILLGGMQEPGHALGICFVGAPHPSRDAVARPHRPRPAPPRHRGGASLALARRHADAPGDRAGDALGRGARGRATRSPPSSRRRTATTATGPTPTATTSTAAGPTPRSASAPTTAPARRSPATRCACRSRCCSTASRPCGSTPTMRSSSRAGSSARRPTCTSAGIRRE